MQPGVPQAHSDFEGQRAIPTAGKKEKRTMNSLFSSKEQPRSLVPWTVKMPNASFSKLSAVPSSRSAPDQGGSAQTDWRTASTTCLIASITSCGS